MKKILLSIAVLLLIVILAAPAVVGWVVEDQLTTQIAAANQREGLRIEQRQYRRGWLTSRAEYTVTVTRAEGDTVTAAALDIHHGPLPVSALWTDGVPFSPSVLITNGNITLSQLAVKGIESPEALPPLEVLATVNFNRKVDYQCSHPGGELSFTRPARAAAKLNWQAGDCSGVVSAKTGDASGNIATAGLTFADGATDLEAAGISSDHSFQTAKSAGHFSSRLGTLSGRLAHSGTVDSIAANNVLLESQLSSGSDMLYALIQANVDSFSLRDFELSSGVAELAIENVPRSTLNGESQAPKLQSVLANAELLVKNISGQLKQGAIDITGEVNLQALGNAELSLESALQSLNGKANIVVDEPLLGYALSNYAAPRIGDLWYASTEAERDALRAEIQNSQQLKLRELLRDGWLVAEGDRFRSDIDYADGELTVNGNAIRDPGGI